MYADEAFAWTCPAKWQWLLELAAALDGDCPGNGEGRGGVAINCLCEDDESHETEEMLRSNAAMFWFAMVTLPIIKCWNRTWLPLSRILAS